MIRISVKVPTKYNKLFSFSLRKRLGGGTMKANNGVSVYRRLENRLKKTILMGAGKVKILVKVDYGDKYLNEGEYTTKRDSLYALGCFLEDYLPELFLQGRSKRYYPKAR